jgi:hypothetical protein
VSHPAQVHPTRTARRWISVVALSLTVASVPAIAAPLAPRDIRVVNATHVALAAQPTALAGLVTAEAVPVAPTPANNALPDPQQQQVIDDFLHGGIAGVLKAQATSRLTSPDQTKILDDFFEGGVFQSEAHRFLQLFTDPQQHQFISDLVTGGLVQVVRNRLLDATGDPARQAAIIALFPDEVTDYRGGPIAIVQRRLIAAAKGNPAVINLVNTIFENPVVVAVQHLFGGGPLIGTPCTSCRR